MHASHGMFIPDQDKLMDMESFIGYLATEVREWHECLYCGATKYSTLSIQSHMRDKGHCLLNFDREPELLEFWDDFEQDDEDGTVLDKRRVATLSETEMRFPSGKVVESRHATLQTKKAVRKETNLTAATVPALSPDDRPAERSSPLSTEQPRSNTAGRQLAKREEMGILGISVQQRQALVLAEKKAQRSEATAYRAREWIRARGANSQKFDQLDNQMKWGKQNHKLLPR